MASKFIGIEFSDRDGMAAWTALMPKHKVSSCSNLAALYSVSLALVSLNRSASIQADCPVDRKTSFVAISLIELDCSASPGVVPAVRHSLIAERHKHSVSIKPAPSYLLQR
jgi:hypothetical protein